MERSCPDIISCSLQQVVVVVGLFEQQNIAHQDSYFFNDFY